MQFHRLRPSFQLAFSGGVAPGAAGKSGLFPKGKEITLYFFRRRGTRRYRKKRSFPKGKRNYLILFPEARHQALQEKAVFSRREKK
jgi:hypothetical protein